MGNKKTLVTIIVILIIGYLGYIFVLPYFIIEKKEGTPEVIVEYETKSNTKEVGIMDSSKSPIQYINKEDSNYLLYYENEINLYNLNGDLLDSDKISKGDLSYIGVRDQGLSFSYTNKKKEYLPDVDYFYYLNKEKKDLYKYEINKKGFKDIDKYNLKEKNISKLYAYNEIIFYSTYSTTGKMFTNKYDIKRGDEVYTDVYFDQIDYKFDPIHTYIYILNTGSVNTDYGKKELIEIPFRVTDWVANEGNIYFITDSNIGRYDLTTNRIYLYNNFKGLKNIYYSNNKDGGVFGIIANKELEEGYIFKYDERNLKVIDVYSFIGGEYEGSAISDDTIAVNLKVPSSEGGFRTETKIFNFNGAILGSMTQRYIPTNFDISNGIIYSLNKFSTEFTVQLMNTTAKRLERGRFSGISAVNLYYKDNFNYSKKGELLNLNCQLVNKYGELISKDGTLMGKNGFILDNYGREINKQTGLPVDSEGNIIDSNGNILNYVSEPTSANSVVVPQHYMYDEKGNRLKIKEGE